MEIETEPTTVQLLNSVNFSLPLIRDIIYSKESRQGFKELISRVELGEISNTELSKQVSTLCSDARDRNPELVEEVQKIADFFIRVCAMLELDSDFSYAEKVPELIRMLDQYKGSRQLMLTSICLSSLTQPN